jgi:MerR family Zn(II)-responsive transcriptional regulator of zntA
MPGSYSIGEIAGLTGVSVETLRYYERRLLLKPPPRTDGGFRRYGSDVVAHVTFIRQAQSLGLSLEDVHRLLTGLQQQGRAGCRRVHDLLARRVADVDRRVAELRALRSTLGRHLAACDRTLQDAEEVSCPTVEALQQHSR